MPSGFTIINLKQIDDTVGERVPEIEGRFGRSSLDSEHLGVSYWRYQPGYRGKQGHRHREPARPNHPNSAAPLPLCCRAHPD